MLRRNLLVPGPDCVLVKGLQGDAGWMIALPVGFIILRLTFVLLYEIQTAGTYYNLGFIWWYGINVYLA